ncbi:NAD-binding protein [Ensifer sp. 4252]|uniref:NAD-binding protein n=1 Tax=Ensifer sp. 4252 TaxID=3373915 RepID=UPI003D1A5FC0
MTDGQTILIVGGYGHVGTRIARRLIDRNIGAVVIAGRNVAKAGQAAARLGCSARAVDLSDPARWEHALADIDMVVVCIDQDEAAFASFILSRGLVYIDVTASDAFFQKVERLEKLARENHGCAILSVGFAPGLTNLMVKACAARLDQVSKATIGIMLGLGDDHGPAAIAWTLNRIVDAEQPPEVAELPFGLKAKKHPALAFDFADQHVLRRTLAVVDTATYLTFDSAAISRLAFLVLPLLRGRLAWVPALTSLLSRVRLGSKRAALSITVSGSRNGAPRAVTALYEGQREAEITAEVAALTIEHMLSDRPAAGIHHLETLMNIDNIAAQLRDEGGMIDFSESSCCPPFVG